MLFTGTLNVEPNDFKFNVERMIVHDDKISFDGNGLNFSDNYAWNFDAVAIKQPEGYFFTNTMKRYGDGDYDTSIYILRCKRSPEECDIEGFWYERKENDDARIWYFFGTLSSS